jgi:predicted nucleic acid-binding protein
MFPLCSSIYSYMREYLRCHHVQYAITACLLDREHWQATKRATTVLVPSTRGQRYRPLWVSPLVIGECEPTCAATLLKIQQKDALHFVDPNYISSETFLELLSLHELGEGETECIAICLSRPFVLVCDDNKARQLARDLLGPDRVIGSIRLLKWCVIENLITADAAFKTYELMRATGGFLPQMLPEWFSDGQP